MEEKAFEWVSSKAHDGKSVTSSEFIAYLQFEEVFYSVFLLHPLLPNGRMIESSIISRRRRQVSIDSEEYKDGILFLEVNRMLRTGGYFVWAAQPVYKHENKLHTQWKGLGNRSSSVDMNLRKVKKMHLLHKADNLVEASSGFKARSWSSSREGNGVLP
uniref:Methyltransferase n=1 Tax=Lactuca sativa TaxID=4236 RepID=A0A9R1V9L3_LACSA|nr:hypothetical protein LSAT_V11C600339400 [Lactuca sativa]